MFRTDFRFWRYRDGEGRARENPRGRRIYGPVSHVGPLVVCAYVIETREGLIAVDAGLDCDREKRWGWMRAAGFRPEELEDSELTDTSDPDLVMHNIASLGLNPRDLKVILITHWHWDHAGGAARLAKATGAKVMVQERDAAVVETGRYRGEWIFPACPVARRLKDGDVVELGGVKIKTVHCPGQSEGSAVFTTTLAGADGPCRVVFAGDAMGFKDSVKELEWMGYPGVCAEYRRTTGILRGLEFDLMLTGHSHQIVNEARADGNPFISREEWLNLLAGREEAMERFVAGHPAYLQW